VLTRVETNLADNLFEAALGIRKVGAIYMEYAHSIVHLRA